MRTEIDLPNPGERLYPGMYAEVTLEMDRRIDALTLPASAIESDGGGSFVYTVNESRIARIPVKTGLHDNGDIEVTAGLSDEKLVVANIRSAPLPGTLVQTSMGHGNS